MVWPDVRGERIWAGKAIRSGYGRTGWRPDGQWAIGSGGGSGGKGRICQRRRADGRKFETEKRKNESLTFLPDWHNKDIGEMSGFLHPQIFNQILIRYRKIVTYLKEKNKVIINLMKILRNNLLFYGYFLEHLIPVSTIRLVKK